jgi:two-component system, NarL family, nitrate/nitrite response regulator NarL
LRGQRFGFARIRGTIGLNPITRKNLSSLALTRFVRYLQRYFCVDGVESVGVVFTCPQRETDRVSPLVPILLITEDAVMGPGSVPVIRILLVDSHTIFLAGLRLLLQSEAGLEIVGEARNAQEARAEAASQPDIILLDLHLGAESGLDLLPDLIKVAEGSKVLILTGVTDTDLHVRAVCLGAMGVVLKFESPQLLLKAIRKVHAGEAWLNRTTVASAMTQLQSRRRKVDPEMDKIASLTAREREVISLIGEGRRNKAIGERLFISEKTVRHYLTSIFDKLELDDRLELLIYAYQHGLAKIPSRPTGDLPPIPETSTISSAQAAKSHKRRKRRAPTHLLAS